MDRFAKLLSSIDRNCLPGLEIGPLHRPTLKKSDANVFYADFASRDFLVEKYNDDPHVDVLQIVNVDFILDESGLELATGGGFGYVIASHVAEHVPNLVGWLEDVANCLVDGGVLSLALPDKRFTFDHLRNSTTIQSLLACEIEDLKRPNSFQILDFVINFSEVSPEVAWKNFRSGLVLPSNAKNTMLGALSMANRAFSDEIYEDVHCSVFTSYEFIELMFQLAKLEKLNFLPHMFIDTSENDFEFFISMKKSNNKQKIKSEWNYLLESQRNITDIKVSEYIDSRVMNLEDSLNNLLNSKSWKLTSPIRKARRWLTRVE